jgi:hypothetical protein
VNEEGKTIYGKAKGFCVWIRSDEKDNVGLFEHEFEHVRQFWKLGLLHMILLWSSSYREWTEKEAMEKQIRR